MYMSTKSDYLGEIKMVYYIFSEVVKAAESNAF